MRERERKAQKTLTMLAKGINEAKYFSFTMFLIAHN